MDENQQDQPLSSEELLRRAREGLGTEDTPTERPADFNVESYKPATPEPVVEEPTFTPEPEFTQPDFTEPETPEPDITPPPAFDPPVVDTPRQSDTSSWAPPPVEATPDPVWGASTPPPTGPAPMPTSGGRKGGGISSKLWIVAVVVIAGIAIFSFLDPSKTVDEIAVGDCMDLPSEDEFYEVDTIDCTEPHDLEIIAIVDLQNVSSEFSLSAPYPGIDAVGAAAFEACQDDFASYVGSPYETSAIYMDVFTPTIEGWNEVDDRVVNCFIFEVDEAAQIPIQSSFSLRGSGR